MMYRNISLPGDLPLGTRVQHRMYRLPILSRARQHLPPYHKARTQKRLGLWQTWVVASAHFAAFTASALLSADSKLIICLQTCDMIMAPQSLKLVIRLSVPRIRQRCKVTNRQEVAWQGGTQS